jgi:HSP20 family protein
MSNPAQNSNIEDILPLIFQSMLLPNLNSERPTHATTSSAPKKFPVDMVSDEKNVYIYAEMPGASSEKINIDIYNNKLTISCEKTKIYPSSHQSEIQYGNFSRVITLPLCITNPDTVKSAYVNGVLKIRIDKQVEERNRFSFKPTEEVLD